MANFSIEPNPLVPVKVRYEHEHVLVVEKPARLVTIPGKGHDRNSLLNGLFALRGNELQNLGKGRDFGVLHRLDRETSGLLLVATSAGAYDGLRAQFEERKVRKFYIAIAADSPRQDSGVIRRPIAEYRASHAHKEMKLAKISPSGNPAVTAYRVISRSAAASLLECRAVTGKLHQLRVHLQSIGCPIFGDDVYAPPAVAAAAPRLMLHAHRLAFQHPLTGEQVDVSWPLPREMRSVAKRLNLDLADLDAASKKTGS
ncbi:MAG: RluA family pseudouridine synthase [Phycisphaerales bacterium]|nr:RluA family pseudouridine synthase [Planctomycetota bacterium]